MIKPTEIRNDIYKHPPLQRRLIAESYKGLKISWELIFKNAFTVSKNQNDIVVHGESGGVDVLCQVDRNDYPELNTFQVGGRLLVQGEIAEAEYQISLKNCKLFFSDNKDELKDSKPKEDKLILPKEKPNLLNTKDSPNINLPQKNKSSNQYKKSWYERPFGIVFLMVIGGLIVAFFVYKLGWNSTNNNPGPLPLNQDSSTASSSLSKQNFASSTSYQQSFISAFDIIERAESYKNTYEMGNYLKDVSGLKVEGVGYLSDIGDHTLTIRNDKDIHTLSEFVICQSVDDTTFKKALAIGVGTRVVIEGNVGITYLKSMLSMDNCKISIVQNPNN